MRTKLAELEAFAADVFAGGYTDVVLLGMGGSSLWPEVLSVVWRDTQVGKAGAALHVLDNTDPAAVAAVEALVAGKKTLFVVASKSGGTIEIQAFERHFWQKTLERSGGDIARAGANFVAITDPATRLGQLAEEKHYRRVFINPADIGGRYSALSYFGLVPAALVGTDVGALLASATEFAAASGAGVPVAESPAVVLGAALGAAVAAGRDKLTLVISPDIASFGSWIEQLVAESAGKEGKGIVPVDLEPVGPPESYGDDRFFVYIRSARSGDAKQDAAVTALERAGQPVVRIAVDRARGAGAGDLPLGDGDRDRVRQHGRQPVRRAERHRGEGGDQRAAGAGRGGGQAAGPRGHLRGHRPRSDPRAPRDGDAERLPRLLRLFPAHARARRGADPHARRLPRPHAQRDHGRLRAALPALDRAAPQGRPEHGRVPAAHGGHGRRSAGARRELQLRDPARRAGARRPAGPQAPRAGARCASTWAPTSTPAWRRWRTRSRAKRKAAPASRRKLAAARSGARL